MYVACSLRYVATDRRNEPASATTCMIPNTILRSTRDRSITHSLQIWVPTNLWSHSSWSVIIVYFNKKLKYTPPAVRSKISSKLIFASYVWYSDRAYYGLRVLIKDIGRRLPLQLQCSYRGQQGDVSQSVRGNYKTRFWGGQNLTAVEGNASAYQVNYVSRITGEGIISKSEARRPTVSLCVYSDRGKTSWRYSRREARCRGLRHSIPRMLL